MLEVFISSGSGCEPCAHARDLAARVAESFPEVGLLVIEVDDRPELVPDDVIAVPTFRLDGRVLSLGNPSWHALVSAVEQSDATRSAGGH